MGKIHLGLACSLLLVNSAIALPPPAPSAGVVEREIEKEYEGKPLELEKEIPAIRIDIPKEQLRMARGVKMFVGHVVIRGNEAVSEGEILDWITCDLGKECYIDDIYTLCQKIEEGYAKKGYFLARAYPPPQDIVDDTLVIEVLEGKLGKVTVVGNKHYSDGFVASYFARLQGRPLNYDEFVRALMLLNDNTDMMAGVVLEKGQEFGCADVIVRVEDKRPIHLYINGNNYGRDLTTNVRAGGRFDWGNCITQGDTFSVAEVVGFPVEALYFTDVIYKVPVNRNGTFLEGAYLFSKFKVEELTRLHLRGESNIATFKVIQSLTRTRAWSIDAFSYFDYKQIQNFVLSHRQSFDKLRVVTVGALFDHFAPSYGRDYLTVQFAAGIPDFLGGLKAVDSTSSRRGGGGRFFMLTADYDRIQLMPGACYFYFHGSLQLSPSKLTLPQQLYIGGVDTVRGFPLAVALGDSGYYSTLEFRTPIPGLAEKRVFGKNKKWKDVLQLDFFLDSGGAKLNGGSSTVLWGTGLGLKINGPYGWAFSIDVGFPLNHRKLTNGAFVYIKLVGKAF